MEAFVLTGPNTQSLSSFEYNQINCIKEESQTLDFFHLPVTKS